MVLEIIIAAILIAFGILVIYFGISGEIALGDTRFMGVLALGVLSVMVGSWAILSKITILLILKKIGGLLLALFGLFLVTGFPDLEEYQGFSHYGFSKAGIFIGIVVFIVGAWLLFF
jgi:hypothetical protein